MFSQSVENFMPSWVQIHSIIEFRDESFSYPSFPNKRYGKVLSVNLIERLY